VWFRERAVAASRVTQMRGLLAPENGEAQQIR
jgi:hypothetical protein